MCLFLELFTRLFPLGFDVIPSGLRWALVLRTSRGTLGALSLTLGFASFAAVAGRVARFFRVSEFFALFIAFRFGAASYIGALRFARRFVRFVPLSLELL